MNALEKLATVVLYRREKGEYDSIQYIAKSTLNGDTDETDNFTILQWNINGEKEAAPEPTLQDIDATYPEAQFALDEAIAKSKESNALLQEISLESLQELAHG